MRVWGRGLAWGGGGIWSSWVENSSVASPICQERQSERTLLIFPLFLIFSLFFPIFPDFLPLLPDFWQFFRCQGGTLPPLTSSGYATGRKWITCNTNYLYQVCIVLHSLCQRLGLTRSVRNKPRAKREYRAPKARESAGGERRAKRVFRQRRKRFTSSS